MSEVRERVGRRVGIQEEGGQPDRTERMKKGMREKERRRKERI